MQDIIDLDRYPLDRPGSSDWQALVERCRADLVTRGMFDLDGLIPGDVAASMVEAMIPRFASDAFLHERMHNIYFKPVEDLPRDHPALRQLRTANRTLCADQIAGSPLLRLYDWPEFARFLAAALDKPELHVMDDPLARVNVMAYGAGQALNWHFDRSEFTTTLLLQAPEAGGGFEYRTDLRSDTDPNYDGVARLLAGEDPESQIVTLSPGTLSVFRGRNTAHRVTPVEGARARVIAVFSYYERPGVTFTEAERIGFYGRAR